MERPFYLKKIEKEFLVHGACALLGPRQVGKTTIAKQFVHNASSPVHYFDLENPDDLIILQDPLRAFENLKGYIIIDEIQRRPELFPTLRYLIDQKKSKFLILGSASRDLILQSSESLAGRIGYIEVEGFSVAEGMDQTLLMERGGFPSSYLAENYELSFHWRKSYIRTFLERDIPALGITVNPLLMYRFWQMLCNVHGGIININDLSTSLSISGHTLRRYLEILCGTFMTRLLVPWHENISKRQIKTPKFYIRDIGILTALLSLNYEQTVWQNPRIGFLWEGFAIEQITSIFQIPSSECFFWKSNQGAELDLLLFIHGKKIGFELKYSDTPTLTKSMHIALQDLKLDHLFIVYPGKKTLKLSEQITLIGLTDFLTLSRTPEFLKI
ncbi:MAG: hypothetical protein B7Y25_06600 [Alphaproteobacteria bacterium 16-39-46]|nr:MAG: hypothetical protein B7Y25_06600 [Alphaproteobacteria bacterium 16-39-46]OZA42254.1 MAG: hypothetical protein B7X84_06675 [Alphaproteobacteria bacterium 17-39-52]HQS84555.1 ATP-binding protein [Alphaproteobacteria bacterium]HQS94308.1 ATP-binding protein [Alphaproteobacteria bacterium]